MNIIENMELISDKAKEVFKSGVKKSEEIIRISRLKMDCIQLNNRIKRKYSALGRNVYLMVKNDSADADIIADSVFEIELLHKELEETRKKIELMNKIVTCPVCETKNSFMNTYCSNCSHRLVVTDEFDEYDSDTISF